jgi:hypothetical protein
MWRKKQIKEHLQNVEEEEEERGGVCLLHDQDLLCLLCLQVAEEPF